MAVIDFLEAKVPLRKEFSFHNNVINTKSYPCVSQFKSHRLVVTTIKDLFTALKEHGDLGHCILKGRLKEQLEWEPRRGMTRSEDTTEWVCLDLDNAPFKSPEAFMNAHPLLKDVSYVIQYSASQGLQHKQGLSCHIFFLLSHPYHAEYIKAWLMEQNLNGTLLDGSIKKAVTLNPAAKSLHYPIDITACQNDKLIFIAPPLINKGVVYKLKQTELIQLVPKSLPALPIERLRCDQIDRWRKEAKAHLNLLREAAKLPPLQLRTKWIEDVEVTKGIGTFTITEMWEDNDFVRFNFNGGDSGAYWHTKKNFEIIGDFKTGDYYETKEILPNYYKQKIAERKAQNQTPVDNEKYILAICDKRTGRYLKVAWTPEHHRLELYPADSVTQLTDWLLSHGLYGQDFVPQWTVEFNPQSTQIIDMDANHLNTFVPSPWLREAKPDIKAFAKAPTIKRIIAHAVSLGEWTEVTEHFMNWLAVIFQFRTKTRTAWVLHGTEGTGKGLLFNKVIKPLLGKEYCHEIVQRRLEDQFNGWMERALFVFVDEAEIGASMQKAMISGELRNWITEDDVNIRFMQKTAVMVPNSTNFLFGSNKQGIIEIDSRDRRYNIGERQPVRLAMTDKEVACINDELPHFLNYLMAYPASKEKAGQIIHTSSRKAVIEANQNSIEQLCEALIDGNIAPLLMSMPDMKLIAELHGAGHESAVAAQYDNIVRREMRLIQSVKKPDKDGLCRVESKLTRDELWVLFEHNCGNTPRSPHKFTRLLKHKNITTKRMRLDDGLSYGISVEWVFTLDWLEQNKLNEPAVPSAKLKRIK